MCEKNPLNNSDKKSITPLAAHTFITFFLLLFVSYSIYIWRSTALACALKKIKTANSSPVNKNLKILSVFKTHSFRLDGLKNGIDS